MSTTVLPVREVLRLVEDGRFRLPPFQRSFVWSAKQVSPFLESLSLGFPTGPMLFFLRPAGKEIVHLGAVRIEAPAMSEAFWIVDGGQRLTVLASVFHNPAPLRFAFDFETGQVVERDAPELLPLSILGDDRDFATWQASHPDRAADAESLRARFLDYPISFIVVPDDASALEVFTRMNSTGVRLSQAEIEHAHGMDQPRDFETLLVELNSLRFGRFPVGLARDSVNAVSGSVPDAWRALRTTVAWLRDEAFLPHQDIWRRPELLPVLARFFALNVRPTPRARILLRRWLWRTMGLAGQPSDDALAEIITGRDSVDASDLLASTGATPPSPEAYLDAVGAELALTTLTPLSPSTGEPIPVIDVLSRWGREAFRNLAGEPVLSPPDEGDLNAILRRPAVWNSHALDREMLDLLSAGEETEFRRRRRRLLAEALRSSSGRLAAWGASDRPAISALLVSDEEDDDG